MTRMNSGLHTPRILCHSRGGGNPVLKNELTWILAFARMAIQRDRANRGYYSLFILILLV
jgi:hypothetical protein